MRILCVDDEPLALEMLAQAIEEAIPDADLHPFKKQSELLADAEANGCDIAFLDIHMRGMNGVELAKNLKQVNPKMNIIFVTGFDEYTGDAMRLHAIVPKNDALLRVQCFGNFDVFTPDGKPVHFERSKSKEVFAYLVHRHGSSCTIREIAAALFEDEPYDSKQQAYLQKIMSAMMKSLKKVNAQKTVNKSYNSLSVNVNTLDCDYYRFQELDAGAVNAYQNEYMSQYYWADFLYEEY